MKYTEGEMVNVKKRKGIVSGVIISLLAIGISFSNTGDLKAGPADPAVLIISNTTEHRLSPEVLREIHEAGFKLSYIDLKHGKNKWDQLEHKIPRANVILMLGAGVGNPDGSVDIKHGKYFKMIREFAQSGGGVFYLCAERYIAAFIGGGYFMKPLGIQLGYEFVYNKQPFTKTPWKVDYAYTADIKPSPVTSGVKGLWYPVKTADVGLRGSARETLSLVFTDGAWQTPVRTGENAYSLPYKSEVKSVRDNTRKEGYEKDPPIFGIREFGKGRFAVSAVTYAYYVGHASLTTLEGIVWDKGTEGKPSDGKKLFINTLNWLAEQSINTPQWSALDHDDSLLVPRDHIPVAPPRDWTRIKFSGRPQKSLKGIIGVRSAYSSGRGIVAEWKQKALEAGLDFLVFLEEFALLTPEKLESLKKECKELSDGNILLLPGFTYENYIGMKSYCFNANLPFPPKKMLAPGGKRFGDGVAYAPKNWRGQLSRLRMAWNYDTCARKVVTGWYDFGNMPIPYEDCGQYDTIPVVTLTPQKENDEGFVIYKKACRDKQYPLPIALDFLTLPGQLKDINTWKTCAFFSNLAELFEYLDMGYSSRTSMAEVTTWVTNGPEIINWEFLGNHDYTLANKDEFVWQNALRKIHLKTRSKNGLKEVKIWDGTKLFRRFGCDGKEFELFLNFDKRDQQRELIAEIIDRKGQRAVTGPIANKNHYLQQVNCSDRNNQLPGSLHRRRDGSLAKFAYLSGTPNKRTGFMGCSPAVSFSEDVRIGLAAFDGAPHARFPSVSEAPLLAIMESYHKYKQRVFQSPWGEEENGSHHIAVSTFSGMDVLVGDRFVEDIFDDQVDVIHVWNTMWKIKPREFSTWHQRRLVLRPRADEPLIFDIWQYKLKLKKDVTYKEGAKLGLIGPRINRGVSELWSVGPEGASLTPVAGGSYVDPEGKVDIDSPFGPGAWAACLGGKSGGVIVFGLTPGLKIINIGNPRKPSFHIGFSPSDSPKKAGEEAVFSIAVVGVPRYVEGYTERVAVYDASKTPADIKSGLGLGRAPDYKAAWPKGKPEKAGLVCPVKAENGVVITNFEKCPDLIAPVPVLVKGLNPNWTVMIYDYQRKVMRALGQFEGKAMVMVDPQVEGKHLFIGQPIQAGDKDLVIHLVQTGDKNWDLEIHNPTERPIKTRCRSMPEWPAFKFEKDIEVRPGTSQTFDIQ